MNTSFLVVKWVSPKVETLKTLSAKMPGDVMWKRTALCKSCFYVWMCLCILTWCFQMPDLPYSRLKTTLWYIDPEFLNLCINCHAISVGSHGILLLFICHLQKSIHQLNIHWLEYQNHWRFPQTPSMSDVCIKKNYFRAYSGKVSDMKL